MVVPKSISRNNNSRAEPSRTTPQPLCSIIELLGDIMLNCGCKCLIFSELSGSKIELLDFWTISGIFSGCLGLITNILHTKQHPNSLNINKIPQKGCGGTGAERAKTGGCDPKKFFFVKFTRSVCEDGVVPSEIGS